MDPFNDFAAEIAVERERIAALEGCNEAIREVSKDNVALRNTIKSMQVDLEHRLERIMTLEAALRPFAALAESWRAKAVLMREEADRIRRTIKISTGAEERCYVRSEVLDVCVDELLEKCAAELLAHSPPASTSLFQEIKFHVRTGPDVQPMEGLEPVKLVQEVI